jgi:hypothetical protein
VGVEPHALQLALYGPGMGDTAIPDSGLSQDDPSDAELLARARDLQLAGQALLCSLDLPGLFADVGPVRVMGSVVSGLMVWRDLDVGLLAGPDFTPLDILRVLERVVVLPGVVGFDYRDERGDRTPADQRDERYHVTIHIEDGRRDTWFLDLSVFLYDLHDHVADWHESLRTNVTAEQRRAILRIKDVWHRRPEYPHEIGGWEIYQAVLHHDVRTPEAFGAWLDSQTSGRTEFTA